MNRAATCCGHLRNRQVACSARDMTSLMRGWCLTRWRACAIDRRMAGNSRVTYEGF